MITDAEKASLSIFANIQLNRDQVDAILRRKLTNREWASLNTEYKSERNKAKNLRRKVTRQLLINYDQVKQEQEAHERNIEKKIANRDKSRRELERHKLKIENKLHKLNQLTIPDNYDFGKTRYRPETNVSVDITNYFDKNAREVLVTDNNDYGNNIEGNSDKINQFNKIAKDSFIKNIQSAVKKFGSVKIKLGTKVLGRWMNTKRVNKGTKKNPRWVVEEIPGENYETRIIRLNEVYTIDDSNISRIKSFIEFMFGALSDMIAEKTFRQSGAQSIQHLNFKLTIMHNQKIVGSSYIQTPKWIANHKATINVKNDDQRCFMWAVLSILHKPDIHAERTSKYKDYIDKYDWSMLNFPVAIRDIPKFEEANQISVNVFGYNNNPQSIYPLYNSKFEFPTLDLLLLEEAANLSELC